MHVDISFHSRKQAKTFVEKAVCSYAQQYVNDLRNPSSFSDFYSMSTIVSNLKAHQETLLKGQRKYSNPLTIYAWANGKLNQDNIIQIQRQKEETPIAQIVLNAVPAPAAAPAVEPAPKRGRGRPSGSGSRNEQLKIRCSTDLLEVLHEMQQSSWSFTGQSHADIIHAAVKSLARNQFPDAEGDLIKAIDRL